MKAAWIALMILMIAFAASAQFDFKKTLAEGKGKAAEEAAFTAAKKKMKVAIDKVNKDCGLKITGAFDKKSFAGKLKDDELKSLGGPACEEALIALGTVCQKQDLRPRIEKITKYSCSYGAESSLKLVKKERLAAVVNPTTTNIDKFKVDVLSLF